MAIGRHSTTEAAQKLDRFADVVVMKGKLEAMRMLSRWCILYYHMDYSNLT